MSKKKTDQTLNKCDELIERLQQLKKAITTVGSTMAPSNRKPVNGLGAGWSMDPSTGSLHHSTQGIISTFKHPEGYFQIKHGGRSVGRAASPAEAGAKIKSYVQALRPDDTGMHNMDPMAMKNEDAQPMSPLEARKKAVKDRMKKAESERDPAKRAAAEEAERLKKNFSSRPTWANHSGVPNGDAEVLKAQAANPAIQGEDALANQLANMMAGKAMLGNPPKQPTDQEMFGHLVPSEEQIQKAEKSWGGAINNWLEEASKPISSRFASQEEEEAYWASIRVSDRDDGKSGY
jgi:hypothetical protein